MARGYLFSDIDGSTQKWERNGAAMQAAMARHDQIFAELIEAHGGFIHDRAGDGVFAIFEGGDPVACALDLQLALEREPWPGIEALRVRLGVHVGPEIDQVRHMGGSNVAERIAVNRAARIAASAWGGQILLSADAAAAYATPNEAHLIDLGAIQLRGVDAPMQVFGLAHPLLKQNAFAPLRAKASTLAHLPQPSGTLVGRELELAQLLEHLRGPGGLINLVGPAGVGKTRLAVEAARLCAQIQPILYAPIESERADLDLWRLLARALGLPLGGEAEPRLAVCEILRAQAWIIILDNSERLSPQAFEALSVLREQCRDCVILCVSRTPIERAAHHMRLSGLSQPDDDVDLVAASAAYQLFKREAQRVGVDLPGDAHANAQFQKLCARLGGLPLALQLSAVWLRYLTLEAIVARVSAPGGHELSEIFADTWEALSPDLRDALGRLSLFRAPFSLRTSEEVAHASISTLMALENRGLLQRAADRKFELHPLLAGLARARAKAEGDEVCAAHAEYFLSETMLGPSPRGEPPSSLEDIEEAWAFARSAWSSDAVRIAGERVFYWCAFVGYFIEGARLFESAAPDAELHDYLTALRANCLVHANLGQAAEDLAREIAASEDVWARAHGRHALGNLAHGRGDFAEAQGHYQAALQLRRDLGDRMGAHYTNMSLAALALARGQDEAVADHLAGAFLHAIDHPIALLHAHFFAGEAALAQERHDAAKFNFARALELDETVEHPAFRVRLLLRKAGLERAEGRIGDAAASAVRAVNLARALGDVRGAGFGAVEQGLTALAAKDVQRAQAELTNAVRIGLELRSKPIVARALLGLLEVEIEAGDPAAAQRLLEVLEGADLGGLRRAFERLKKAAPITASASGEHASLMEQGARTILRL